MSYLFSDCAHSHGWKTLRHIFIPHTLISCFHGTLTDIDDSGMEVDLDGTGIGPSNASPPTLPPVRIIIGEREVMVRCLSAVMQIFFRLHWIALVSKDIDMFRHCLKLWHSGFSGISSLAFHLKLRQIETWHSDHWNWIPVIALSKMLWIVRIFGLRKSEKND